MANLQPMGIKAVAEGVGKFNQQIGSMNKGLEGGNKALGNTEKSTASLGKALRVFGAAAGVATAAFLATKKVLAIGREGALITQTGESFDFLIEKIGAAPDLLKQLTEASKGTISELDLMSSTATLLAGAGDELALKLADATPRLLEIAKAANKLNPALGDTAFFYQSIATGVKRAQPLILDNLGLTLKVGKANEDFAKSIGKTVEELTAEEKAMAILQATLAAGDNLINQVGGNTDSATDSFDRLTVALQVTTDKAKVALFTGIQPLVDKMADAVIEGNAFRDAIAELNFEVGKFGIVYDETGNVVTQTTPEIIAAAEENRNYLAGIDATVFDGWNSGLRDTALAAQNVAEANRGIVASLTELTTAKLAQEALVALNTAFKDGEIDAETYKDEYFDVATGMGGMSEAAASGQLALFDLRQELNDGTLSTQGFVTELGNLAAFDGKVYKTTLEIEIIRTGTGVMEGFQHGGQFQVGGKPGVDQNLVAFRATRGEVVTVTPTSNVDNRSVNMGDVSIGQGGYTPAQFDRSMRDWIGA